MRLLQFAGTESFQEQTDGPAARHLQHVVRAVARRVRQPAPISAGKQERCRAELSRRVWKSRTCPGDPIGGSSGAEEISNSGGTFLKSCTRSQVSCGSRED